MTRRQLLIDYGEVISLPQPDAAITRLAALAGLPAQELTRRYWQHREPYDAGQPVEDYWASVLDQAPAPALLVQLIEADVHSWLHLDPAVLELLDAIHADGTQVSLLSNAPRELGVALADLPELARFRHLLFSADLRLIKPDPQIFRAAAERLGAAPQDVVFIDDRAANVRAAAAVGFDAVRYTGSPDPFHDFRAAGDGGRRAVTSIG
jgi:putative hydrolase of the HAD superfamily